LFPRTIKTSFYIRIYINVLSINGTKQKIRIEYQKAVRRSHIQFMQFLHVKHYYEVLGLYTSLFIDTKYWSIDTKYWSIDTKHWSISKKL